MKSRKTTSFEYAYFAREFWEIRFVGGYFHCRMVCSNYIKFDWPKNSLFSFVQNRKKGEIGRHLQFVEGSNPIPGATDDACTFWLCKIGHTKRQNKTRSQKLMEASCKWSVVNLAAKRFQMNNISHTMASAGNAGTTKWQKNANSKKT